MYEIKKFQTPEIFANKVLEYDDNLCDYLIELAEAIEDGEITKCDTLDLVIEDYFFEHRKEEPTILLLEILTFLVMEIFVRLKLHKAMRIDNNFISQFIISQNNMIKKAICINDVENIYELMEEKLNQVRKMRLKL